MKWALRVAFVFVNTIAVLFCYLLFVWLIHDFHLTGPFEAVFPGYGTPDYKPWVYLGPDASVLSKCVFNAALVAFFGCVHSFFAREWVRDWVVARVLHKDAYRTLFITATALAFANLVGSWHFCPGYVVYDLRAALRAAVPSVVPSDAAFDKWEPFARFILHILCLHTVLRLDAFTFLGTRQLVFPSRAAVHRVHDNPVLITTGIYRIVRHPMYFYLQAVVLCASVMSLDRFVYLAASTAYLVVALPSEEAKLIHQFGNAYKRYQQEVPMLVPGLRALYPRRKWA